MTDAVYESQWGTGPHFTTDAVIYDANLRSVVLVQRSDNRKWALPGGFISGGEDAFKACQREVLEETSLKVTYSDQKRSLIFDGKTRDPRSWMITVAFFFDVSHYPERDICAGDDAADINWFTIDQIDKMDLFADHRKIIRSFI